MGFETRLFINNEYVDSKSGETIDVRNPNDDSLVVSGVQLAGPEDVDAAVKAAEDAFKGEWRTWSGAQRAACMNKLADLIDQNVAEFAKLETMSMGQPIGISNMFSGAVSQYWRFYAGFCDKISGESYPEDGDGVFKIVSYEPFGVCAGIGAWNASLIYTGWKIAPAVAVGNTFIFKASEKSPLSAIKLGALVKEAGFPPGVINVISGAGKTGSLLASHMKIWKIGFTGSINTGRKVQDAATKSNLKKVTLELGGKSPSLIFDDANLQVAIGESSQGFLLNSGQICAAASRTFVQESIAPKFIEALKAQFQGLSGAMGDTMNEKTFLGPLADKAQYERVMGFLEEGKKEGVDIVVGGTRKGDKGFFVEPTIILNPDTQAKVYTDEIFGPVLTIKTFKTEEEAIQLANDTSYALSSTLYTNDITRALRVAGKIQAGSVSINKTMMPSKQIPFGGMKSSGNGREVGKVGLMEYLETKSILINMKMP